MNVAVIGASADRKKYGNKAVRAWIAAGHSVYPVNPKENEIEGIRCYKSISEIPVNVDVATLYLPPSAAVLALDQIAEKKVGLVYVNPGVESPELSAKGKTLKLRLINACSILAAGQDPEKL
ncbi:Acetate--CoA ligase [ADP-forming] II subunit alpha [uncultured archaeon]|nr:Acetate--CoA ligase [ADP-forming] II subunit alpha [uncultured archaeon]